MLDKHTFQNVVISMVYRASNLTNSKSFTSENAGDHQDALCSISNTSVPEVFHCKVDELKIGPILTARTTNL